MRGAKSVVRNLKYGAWLVTKKIEGGINLKSCAHAYGQRVIKMCILLVSLVSSTCLLPRTFTNVHKSYFYMSLAQNIHKCSQILFPRLLPRTFTNVHKVYFYMSLAQNIHKCLQILFLHVACVEHSQMFTDLISTCLLPRTFTMFTNLISIHMRKFWTLACFSH